ncbi:MAG: protease complex subunit PrcB family protein [Lachnospiraceae bacterium]|nr:protease complex subunit PrcB family protein [Lachnospiraceae bacterium]MBO5144174.1 protease complex subunit PrcB family protein [Lachnospiraceae bacterium]
MTGLTGKIKKNVLSAVIGVMLVLGISGCSMEEEDAGGKLKDIDFTVVGEEQQPEALKDIIAERSAEPFQISYAIGEDLYIAIGYGEQPSGGYSISVNEFYETDDALIIDTTLIGPGKAENVTNTPTKPYIVIKTENIDGKTIQFQ